MIKERWEINDYLDKTFESNNFSFKFIHFCFQFNFFCDSFFLKSNLLMASFIFINKIFQMKFNNLLTKLILSCCNWSSKEIALENDVQQPKTNKIVAPMKNRRAISPRVFRFAILFLNWLLHHKLLRYLIGTQTSKIKR